MSEKINDRYSFCFCCDNCRHVNIVFIKKGERAKARMICDKCECWSDV